jgi:hypothetical protein
METFADIIDLWSPNRALADELGVPHNTVSLWKHRDRIPAEYWIDIAATERVSLLDLATICAARRE